MTRVTEGTGRSTAPSTRARRGGWVVAALALAWVPAAARAYPTSVVFAPNADARALGVISAFMYGGLIVVQEGVDGPTLSPWGGVQTGLLPRASSADADTLAASALAFGGLEVGVDVFQAADAQGRAFVKPLLNVKLAPLAPRGDVPGLAVGFMGWSPGFAARSNDLLYGVATWAPKQGAVIGRLTMGLGGLLNGDRSVARGTFPFSAESGLCPILGWESPAWGPLSLAIDHLGGVSDVGSTNFALVAAPVPHVVMMLGWTMGNDRRLPFDGPFALLNVDLEVARFVP
jgi:hypothetical protein